MTQVITTIRSGRSRLDRTILKMSGIIQTSRLRFICALFETCVFVFKVFMEDPTPQKIGLGTEISLIQAGFLWKWRENGALHALTNASDKNHLEQQHW